MRNPYQKPTKNITNNAEKAPSESLRLELTLFSWL